MGFGQDYKMRYNTAKINLRIHKHFMDQGRTSKEAKEFLETFSTYKRKEIYKVLMMIEAADKAKSFADLKPEV